MRLWGKSISSGFERFHLDLETLIEFLSVHDTKVYKVYFGTMCTQKLDECLQAEMKSLKPDEVVTSSGLRDFISTWGHSSSF